MDFRVVMAMFFEIPGFFLLTLYIYLLLICIFSNLENQRRK